MSVFIKSFFRPFSLFSVLSLFMAAALLAGCGLFGGDDNPIKTGAEADERIVVLTFERQLEADPRVVDDPVRLPPPYTNTGWHQPGGNAANAPGHVELGDDLRQIFSVSAVRGSGRQMRLMASPVYAENRLFLMGARLDVVALHADSGKRIWQRSLLPEKADIEDGFGGGLAWDNGLLYAATGFGEVMALDADTGNIMWRVQSAIPFRTAPTVADGRVFVVSHDNQLQVYDATDGTRLWNQIAIIEPATILSATSPAVRGDLVVAGFSSGEVLAMRTGNGTVNWSDSLSRTGQLTPLSDLNPIIGRPVIDRDRVFVVSHGGRMVSIDYRSGERVWMSEFTSIETPALAGNAVFIVTTNAYLVCLTRAQGRVRWAEQLQRFEDEDDREDLITWAGPVLAGGRLFLASSTGELLMLSPEDGTQLRRIDIKDAVHIAPIVANNTLYILTDKGRLLAYR